tara:strand:- start:31299 stop:32903 length:1605 start_codon:yes stop_codon:yes gene_type:complete
MIPNFNSIFNFFKQRIFLDKNEKQFVEFNKLKWNFFKLKKTNKKTPIIMVDLFPWYPSIYLWSYMTNLLSKKINGKIKFYYFDFYQSTAGKSIFFIKKLIDIYKSFNASKGLTEYDFIYLDTDKQKYEKQFKKIKTKKELVNYKRYGLKIGELIYDSYVRTTLEPTVNLQDLRLKKIFFRSLKIFDEVQSYIRKNNVQCVIPSHLCYMSYGIICKIALSKKIPVIKIRSDKGGQVGFRLLKVDKYNLNEPEFYNYKKNFAKMSISKKKKGILLGKKILEGRLSGEFDKYLPYVDQSQFHKKKLIKKNINFKNIKKEKIIVFPHCFYDYPHRFRSMIFPDFYEHAIYFMEMSKVLNQYEWYYKPHPHSLPGHVNIHKILLKKYPNIISLNKKISHRELIKLNPKCVITNHGSVAHEYAAFNIPTINTGDNHHINYKFCINVRTKNELNKIMNNLDYYTKKLKINKKEIYEFMYMNFYYSTNLYNENDLIKDNYFITKNTKINHSSEILKYLIKSDKKNVNKIEKYVDHFLEKNFK